MLCAIAREMVRSKALHIPLDVSIVQNIRSLSDAYAVQHEIVSKFTFLA